VWTTPQHRQSAWGSCRKNTGAHPVQGKHGPAVHTLAEGEGLTMLYGGTATLGRCRSGGGLVARGRRV
jgi:hypothetical protein